MLWNGKSVVLWPTSGHFFLPMATGGDDFNISCSYLDLGGGFKSFFCFLPENFGAFFSNLTFRIFWTTGLVVQPPPTETWIFLFENAFQNRPTTTQMAKQPISQSAPWLLMTSGGDKMSIKEKISKTGATTSPWRLVGLLVLGGLGGVPNKGMAVKMHGICKNFHGIFSKRLAILQLQFFFLENIGGSLLITVKTSLYLALRRSQQISSCLLVRCGSLWVCQIFIHGVWTLNSMWPFFSQPRFLENQQSIWVNYDHSMHFKDAKHKSGWLFRFEQNQPLWMVFFLFFAPPTKGIRLQRQRQKPGGHGSLWSDRWEIQVWHHSRDHVPGPVGNSPQQWWWLL